MRLRYRDSRIKEHFAGLIHEKMSMAGYRNCDPPEIQERIITSAITSICDEQLGKSDRVRNRNHPWWTKEVITLFIRRAAARARHGRYRDPSDDNIALHKKARNNYTLEVRKAKLLILREYFSILDDRWGWCDGIAKWLRKDRRLNTIASSIRLPRLPSLLSN